MVKKCVLIGLWVMAAVAGCGFFWTFIRSATSDSTNMTGCSEHMRKLMSAVEEYAVDNDGYLPDSAWSTRTLSYVGRTKPRSFYVCPAAQSSFGYAINKNLVGKSIDDLPERGVLLFECKVQLWDFYGGPEDLARNRHPLLGFGLGEGNLTRAAASEAGSFQWGK